MEIDVDNVIYLAWQDRVTFEEVYKKTGLKEFEVIRIMRNELKPASFRRWRKRVNGRVTKHRKMFERKVIGRTGPNLYKNGLDQEIS